MKRTAMHAATGSAERRYIGFSAGDDHFALDIFRAAEIIRHQEPVPVPQAPEFIKGVIDLRGTVIPIMDFRARLGLPTEVDRRTKILIVLLETARIGLVIDAVDEVFAANAEQHLAVPEYMQKTDTTMIAAVIRHKDRLYFVVDQTASCPAKNTTCWRGTPSRERWRRIIRQSVGSM